MHRERLDPTTRILVGDSLERLKELPDASIDAVVCDPPYGLGKPPPIKDVLQAWLAGDEYQAKGGGMMNKKWDAFVPSPPIWRECLRVLKPGGHLLAFFGARTYGVGEMAIRLAGFEIRDQLCWIYAQGMPKSVNVARVIDQKLDPQPPRGKAIPVASSEQPNGKPLEGNPIEAYESRTDEGREWDGFGTGLSPAHEPICMARKPLEGTIAENVLEHGTAGLNIDGTRVGWESQQDRERVNATASPNSRFTGEKSEGVTGWADGRTRPRADITHSAGRWPANICHDGSPEVLALFPESGPARPHAHTSTLMDPTGAWGFRRPPKRQQDDGGSAARFFFCSKVSKTERDRGLGGEVVSASERAGGRAEGSVGLGNARAGTRTAALNPHPTLKPVKLMRWLCRLVTPPGGTVLDPFMGSGSTGVAARLEGFSFVGCELDPHHAATAELRIKHYTGDTGEGSEAPQEEVESRKPERTGFFY